MQRVSLLLAAVAATLLSASSAQAGLLFFGDCGKPAPSCCQPAKSCCQPVQQCCESGHRCPLTGMCLPKLSLPKLSLPKLSLPKLGGNSCCQPAPSCCQPVAPSCSGGAAHHGGAVETKKVEEIPAPPYEDKAPAPAAEAADKAPAPAPEA